MMNHKFRLETVAIALQNIFPKGNEGQVEPPTHLRHVNYKDSLKGGMNIALKK